MRGIELKDSCIFYYGNPAGYMDKDAAVVDSMFQNGELEAWLARINVTVKWTDGVYDRLITGTLSLHPNENAPILKNCRIWQLRPGASVWKDIITFGKPLPIPRIDEYSLVYDGQLETNELEAIYNKFKEGRPPGFRGHPMSVGDLVELYDDSSGSTFYYLDRTYFRQVELSNSDN